jgi:hypothetical protein
LEDILADFYGNYKKKCSKNLLRAYYMRIRENMNSHYKTGYVTELLCRDNLNRYMKSKGIKRIYKGVEPNSYKIKYQWGRKKGTHRRGVDIWLKYYDENCDSQEYLIEVMGWKKMKFGISDDIYNKRIKSRFETYDPENRCIHMVMITKWNVPFIADRCKRDNIKIAPIPIHPTPSYLRKIMTQQERKGHFSFSSSSL